MGVMKIKLTKIFYIILLFLSAPIRSYLDYVPREKED